MTTATKGTKGPVPFILIPSKFQSFGRRLHRLCSVVPPEGGPRSRIKVGAPWNLEVCQHDLRVDGYPVEREAVDLAWLSKP